MEDRKNTVESRDRAQRPNPRVLRAEDLRRIRGGASRSDRLRIKKKAT